jgi:hypothetical protein
MDSVLAVPQIPRDVIRHYLGRIAWRRQARLEHRGDFDEKYPESVHTAFLVSGNQYFDSEIVRARLSELTLYVPYRKFDCVKIFHPRVPGRRYVIGADVATGRTVNSDETDFCAAVVLDLETGEEMAAYRGRVRPEDLAYHLEELGRYYNDAQVAVERTGDGGTTILVLAGECRYSAIYKHKEWHKREKKLVEIEGFPTTIRTRPVALNFVNKFMCETPHMIWDIDFLNECLTFTRNEDGKPAATPGAHDDTVSARWVAYGARMAILGYWVPYEGAREAYMNADQLAAVN